MARQAVIVGGAGQIGRACARHLAQHGWDVVALSRGEREIPDELDAHGIEHQTIDREDAGTLRGALGGDVDLLIDAVAFNTEPPSTTTRRGPPSRKPARGGWSEPHGLPPGRSSST